MLENYYDTNNVTLNEMKDFIYSIDPFYSKQLERCHTKKKFIALVKESIDYYYDLSKDKLECVRDFDEMEYTLIMMNQFFSELQAYKNVKISIKKKLLRLNDSINMYRILRHIMSMEPEELVRRLHDQKYITLSQAAYFSLVEENIDDAYHYLSKMKTQPCEALLSYYASYDLLGAWRLTNKFEDERKDRLQISYS